MQILNFLSKPRAQAKIQPEFKAPLAKKPHENFERISEANAQAYEQPAKETYFNKARRVL
jgi:hypothetical protein